MALAISRENVVRTYDRWAPVYDVVFGSIFELARRAAIAECERIGGRVLEVGVGTGISLPYYTSRCRVTGIDITLCPNCRVGRLSVVRSILPLRA